MVKVYYGLTNYSQLKRLRRDLPIMVSGRWLINLPPTSTAFKYISEYDSVFLDSGAFGIVRFWLVVQDKIKGGLNEEQAIV